VEVSPHHGNRYRPDPGLAPMRGSASTTWAAQGLRVFGDFVVAANSPRSGAQGGSTACSIGMAQMGGDPTFAQAGMNGKVAPTAAIGEGRRGFGNQTKADPLSSGRERMGHILWLTV